MLISKKENLNIRYCMKTTIVIIETYIAQATTLFLNIQIAFIFDHIVC